MNIIIRVLINLIIVLGIFFYYSQVHGMEFNIMFWKEAKAEEIVIEPVKTLDSEITRLSEKYQVDEKLAREIIRCEGGNKLDALNRNKDKSGNVWSVDFGPMQINDYFHKDTMTKLGLDFNNGYDTLEYGMRLLSTEGTGPWSASKNCWYPSLAK
jgi:hypothetical protein